MGYGSYKFFLFSYWIFFFYLTSNSENWGEKSGFRYLHANLVSGCNWKRVNLCSVPCDGFSSGRLLSGCNWLNGIDCRKIFSRSFIILARILKTWKVVQTSSGNQTMGSQYIFRKPNNGVARLMGSQYPGSFFWDKRPSRYSIVSSFKPRVHWTFSSWIFQSQKIFSIFLRFLCYLCNLMVRFFSIWGIQFLSLVKRLCAPW